MLLIIALLINVAMIAIPIALYRKFKQIRNDEKDEKENFKINAVVNAKLSAEFEESLIRKYDA